MNRHGRLFEQVVSFENLLAAAQAARRGKRFRPDVAAFHFDLERQLLGLHDELCARTYRPGPYHTFHIRDPKPRLISAAPYRDRVVHHAVCRIVEPIFERTFIHDSYACRVGKGTHAALDRATCFCRRFPYALKCDVRKFFPSMDHGLLSGLLARKIKCPGTLWLLDTIIAASNPQEPVCFHFAGDGLFTPVQRPHGIPIGNLTSQFFGNVMLNPLDHFIQGTCRQPAYVRYADDFLVFGNGSAELRELREAIGLFLAGYRLKLHPDKCQVFRVTDGIPFLGWQVFSDHRRLRRRTGVRIQRGLRRLRAAYADGEVDLHRVRASVMSWLGFLRHGDTWGLRRQLLIESPFIRSGGRTLDTSVSPGC